MTPRSILTIFFAVTMGAGVLFAAVMGAAAWVLDRSFTAMITNMASDTGWMFAEGEAYADEEPQRDWDADEPETEEEEEAAA